MSAESTYLENKNFRPADLATRLDMLSRSLNRRASSVLKEYSFDQLLAADSAKMYTDMSVDARMLAATVKYYMADFIGDEVRLINMPIDGMPFFCEIKELLSKRADVELAKEAHYIIHSDRRLENDILLLGDALRKHLNIPLSAAKVTDNRSEKKGREQ